MITNPTDMMQIKPAYVEHVGYGKYVNNSTTTEFSSVVSITWTHGNLTTIDDIVAMYIRLSTYGITNSGTYERAVYQDDFWMHKYGTYWASSSISTIDKTGSIESNCTIAGNLSHNPGANIITMTIYPYGVQTFNSIVFAIGSGSRLNVETWAARYTT